MTDAEVKRMLRKMIRKEVRRNAYMGDLLQQQIVLEDQGRFNESFDLKKKFAQTKRTERHKAQNRRSINGR